MSKKQSLSVTEYLSGLTQDNVDETAATLERTPAMILQCVNILENWNSKMKNLGSSIFEVPTNNNCLNFIIVPVCGHYNLFLHNVHLFV